jgi:hypothetical protein
MRLVALVTSLALGGCSFVMTDRPKPPPGDPDCTRSYGAVGLDIIGALTWPFVAGLVYLGARADGGDLDDDDAGVTGAIVAGTFIAEVVSAGVGVSRVGDCRDAYRARMAYPYYPQPYPQQPPYPQSYPQPQQPPPPPGGLGQVGDSCNIESDCATGLTCQSNLCARR